MTSLIRRIVAHRIALITALLVCASAASCAWLLAANPAPSWLRRPITGFVEPGTTVWWFTLGGPYQVRPRSFTGILWAAIANTAIWLGVVALAQLLVRVGGGRMKR